MTRRPVCLVSLMLDGCAAEPGWVDHRFFVRVDDADLYVHAVGRHVQQVRPVPAWRSR